MATKVDLSSPAWAYENKSSKLSLNITLHDKIYFSTELLIKLYYNCVNGRYWKE